jgi:hypothetical protein
VLSRYLFAASFLVACQGAEKACPPSTNVTNVNTIVTTEKGTPAELAPLAADAVADAKQKCIEKHGEAHRKDIEAGVDQVANLWRTSDGDLAAFCIEQFVADPAARDVMFSRFQDVFEQVRGHNLELTRLAKWGAEVEDQKPVAPSDNLLAAYEPEAHVVDDMFRNKAAFAVLLNFRLTTLEQRIRDGKTYDRRTWAEIRLTGKFDTRIPGELEAAASAAEAAGDQYVAGYNIWMHHVLSEDGSRKFPSGKRLISHWNLRDELKANYADKDGLAKQLTIAKVMERIVTQSIPKAVIDNPNLDWNPFTNKVTVAETGSVEADAPKDRAMQPSDEREPDTRFEKVLAHFHAAQAIDKYSPLAPTALSRAFEGAEIPEERVRSMLIEVLSNPLAGDAAKELETKLGRKLVPHDLWYRFGADKNDEASLDAITKKKYPTSKAFADNLPNILTGLGFTDARAKYLAEHIAVDPSRGAGHAMGAERRGDKAHLRTRVEPDGMNYKGYNIAVHELGHNVEQTFSLYDIDYTLLSGVPNTAFTEALAFLFQARDLQLLGQPAPGKDAERGRVLDAFWNTREIAGSALVELDVWKWLYAHPDATATQLREATVTIARETWNKYFAPYLGGNGTVLLGIYSHTIASPLYLFNYVLGQLIAFQVEEMVADKDKATFAREYERVARQGRILPDLWMEGATGKPVSTQPLLDATKRAFETK